MSRQMPELYLRGAIFNETMKKLKKEQLIEVEETVERLMKTSSLTKSREKFCQTLANTIGADYREDKNAALQEYRIALMKAVVYVLFHKPNRQILEDPVQTRKMFSQFTYNYMKQILNENKIPSSIYEKHVEDQPYVIVYEQITHMLENEGVFHVCEFESNKFIIEGDIGIISLKTAKKIGKLKEKYKSMGVSINANIDKIEIVKKRSSPTASVKIRKNTRIKVASFDDDNKEDNDNKSSKYSLEFEVSQRQKKEPSFDSNYMRSILPVELTELYDIIMLSTKDLNKSELADKLKLSTNEVNKRLEKLKTYYYATKTA